MSEIQVTTKIKFNITLGLGRMASHHPKTYAIEAESEAQAERIAMAKYRKEPEIPARLWLKQLTIESIEVAS